MGFFVKNKGVSYVSNKLCTPIAVAEKNSVKIVNLWFMLFSPLFLYKFSNVI